MLSIDYGFQQQNADHRFIFKDDTLIQALGRRNPTWSIVIPFRQGIMRGGWDNLYLDVFPKFLEACMDKSAGMLEVPDLGAFRVQCVSFRYSLNPHKRDGVDVHVEFIYSPKADTIALPIAPLLGTLDGDVSMANALDHMIVETYWKQYVPPKPTKDLLSSIQSAADSISLQRDKFKHKIEAVTEKVQRVNDSLDRVGDVRRWNVRRQANDLISALHKTAETVGADGKRVVQYVIKHPTPLSVVADNLEMKLPAFLKLNPGLGGMPIIGIGTVVNYIAGK